MKRNNKILVFMLAVAILLPGFVQADVKKIPEAIRISGVDRVETAIKVSQKSYKDGEAKAIALAGYSGQADALIGTILASEKDAPILLTYKDRLDPRLIIEIKRLGAEKVYILGGESVVEAKVEEALSDMNLEIKRLKGETRVETAIAIVDEAFKDFEPTEAFVVEYNALADALAIGPVAAEKRVPLYITQKNSVPKETKEALNARKIKDITIIGGENVVSSSGKEDLEKVTQKTVARISGSNRSETALNIADKFYTSPKSIVVANGYGNYADALVGGYFAKEKVAPILLTNTSAIDSEVLSLIEKTGKDTFVLGGEASVSKSVFEKIVKALKSEVVQGEDIKRVEALIEALPEVSAITLEDEAKVLTAVKEYEALKEVDRALVKNEEKLIEVLGRFEVLKLKDNVEKAILALPNLDNLTLEDKADVESIRGLVDLLLGIDEKVQIKGIETLKAAEVKLEALK